MAVMVTSGMGILKCREWSVGTTASSPGIFIAFHVSTSPGTGRGQSPGTAVQGFRATNQANWVESQVLIRVDS